MPIRSSPARRSRRRLDTLYRLGPVVNRTGPGIPPLTGIKSCADSMLGFVPHPNLRITKSPKSTNLELHNEGQGKIRWAVFQLRAPPLAGSTSVRMSINRVIVAAIAPCVAVDVVIMVFYYPWGVAVLVNASRSTVF